MGEAAERKKVPWPREIAVERHELTDLLSYLVTPVQGQQGVWYRGTKNREERKGMKAALSQLGIYQMWKTSQIGEKTSFKLPVVSVCAMSEEATNYLLGVMTDMGYATSMSLIDFEERLEELKAGLYSVASEDRERAAQPVEDNKQLEGST